MSPDLVTIIIPCSLGNGYCTFGFLIFIIDERNFLYYSLYTLTEKSLKHLCSIRAWVPVSVCLSFFLSFSLSLSPQLILWSTETYLAHSPARASKTLSRRCPGPSPPFERVPGAFVRDASPVTRALLVLCVNQGVSASLFYFLIVASGPPGPGPLKDPNNYLCKLVETMIEKSPAPTSGPKLKE